MSERNRFAAIAMLWLALSGPSFAQLKRTPITVRVTDSSGKPIHDAIVQLAASESPTLNAAQIGGANFSGITDDQGLFTTQIVDSGGPYTVVARRGNTVNMIAVEPPYPQTVSIELPLDTASAAAPPVLIEPAASEPAPAAQGTTAAPPAAPPETFWQQARDLGLTLLLVFAPLISFFLLRGVTVRLVLRYMMRKAPQGSTFSGVEEAAAAGERGAPPGALEILSVNNTNGVLLNGKAQERLERALACGRGSFRPYLLSLLAALAVSLVILGVEARVNAEMRPIALPAAGASAGILTLLLVFGGYCYWMVRRLPVWVSIFAAAVILGAGIAAWKLAQFPVYLAVLPGLAQSGTVWYLVRRMHRRIEVSGNQRLLILRVFGSDKTTAFTFGTLMDRWRYVGSFLTIVDPSYIRFQFAAISPFSWKRTAAVTFWYASAAAVLGLVANLVLAQFPDFLPQSFAAMPVKDRTELLSNAGYLILAPLAVLPIFVYVTRRFAKSQAEAEARIDQATERGRHLRRGVFRGFPTWCFDDVWKPSVRRMLSSAQTVLMDLRGLTPERKGCAYEIGELIDRFPIERTVFLVHDTPDKEALLELIRERWSRMRTDSPNYREKARLKIYETKPRARVRQVRKDVDRILGLLAASVDEAPADAPLKRLVQLA